MAKIILFDELDREHLVATFKTDIEANMSASLLQALLLPDSKKYYRVITKNKYKESCSRIPEDLTRYVGNIKPLYDSLRHLYINF